MPIYNAPGGGGSSITAGDTSIAITDSGTGHAAVSVDGSEVARFTGDGLLLTDADNGDPVLIIRNTGTGATEPEIRFERAHPAVSGSSPDIGHIKFFGLDDAENNTLYANIYADITDNANGSEDGRIIFEVAKAGTTDVEIMRLQSNSVIINEESQDIDFRVESNGNTHMLFVDAGNDRVGIANSSPGFELDVTGAIRATGNVTCNALTQTSMRSLKKNIGDITKTKAKVIPFKEYEFKSGDTTRKRYGVVVEDIENDYPELVYDLGGGVKAVNYIDLLVKRVAEMEKELTEITGAKGDKGDKGDTGAQGATGAQGPAGADGKNGTNGTNGKDGNSHLNNVNSISFNSKFGKTGALEVTIGKTKYRFVPADE